MSTTMYRHLSSGFDWPATCCCDPPTWQLYIRASPCHCGYRLAASGRIGRDPIPKVDLPFPGSHYIVRNGVVTWPDELRCDCKDDPNIPLGTLYLDGFVYPPPISECQGVISYSGVAVGETVTVTLTKPPPFQNKCGYVSHWVLDAIMSTRRRGTLGYSGPVGANPISRETSGVHPGDIVGINGWTSGWICDWDRPDTLEYRSKTSLLGTYVGGWGDIEWLHTPSDYIVRVCRIGRVNAEGECLDFPSEHVFHNDNPLKPSTWNNNGLVYCDVFCYCTNWWP